MDSIRGKINFLNKSIINLFIRLSLATLIYFFLIKKIIVYIFNTISSVYLKNLNNNFAEFSFVMNGDDLIILSSIENIDRFVINLPFSAYYIFFIALIFPKVFKTEVIYVHYYNLALFIIKPLCLFLVIYGHSWLDNLIRVHEISYKILFLALGMYIFSNEHKER